MTWPRVVRLRTFTVRASCVLDAVGSHHHDDLTAAGMLVAQTLFETLELSVALDS